jgi:Phosphoribosylcarboxyaminoimidazole (NCAIR) mutase
MKAAVVMGSKSDYDQVKKCVDVLKDFGVETEVRVISAHRTPAQAVEFAAGAEDRGVEVIIACAGMNERMNAVAAALAEEDTDLVVLAGYLSIVAPQVIKKYDHRIINIHPALLPKHGGKDCYGMGETHDEARARAFDNTKRITFEGAHYRRDVGSIVKHD